MELANICAYCDHGLEAGATKCSVCMADVFQSSLFYQKNENSGEIFENVNASKTLVGIMQVSKQQSDRKVFCEGDEEKDEDTHSKFEVGLAEQFGRLKEEGREQAKVVTDATETSIEIPEDVWVCSACTFYNRIGNQCCEVCFTSQDKDVFEKVPPMRGEAEVSVLPQTKWKCFHCQSDNHFDRNKCSSCQRVSPFFDKWICDKCTFFNELSSIVCDVCGSYNNNCEPCITCRKNLVVKDGCRKCAICVQANEDNPKSRNKGGNNNKETRKEEEKDDFEHIDTDRCILCKGFVNKYAKSICGYCRDHIWFCTNKWCQDINNIASDYCPKCKLRRYSDANAYNQVDIYDGQKFVKKHQCQDCGTFRDRNTCPTCSVQEVSTNLSKFSETLSSAIDKLKRRL